MSVDLIGPDGREYHIEADDPAALAKAQQLGYRQVTADAPATLGEEASGLASEAKDVARAGLHGLIKGATLGFGGTSGDDVVRAEEQAIDEESHIAHGVGEVAGMVASPANVLGEVAAGARGATALARIGKSAISGGVTGGLAGAGNTVSDAMLGDHEVAADKLIAGIGLGALLGAGGGGLGGAISEGVSAVLPKIGRRLSDAQKTLDDLANDSAVSATRAQQRVINTMGEAKAADAGRVLRDRGHLEVLSSADDILKSVEADIAKTGAEKGSILELAEAGGAVPSHAELGARLDALKAGKNPLQQKIMAKELAELQEGLAEIGMRPAGATGKGGSGFAALDDLRQTVAKRAKFSRGAAGVDDEALALKRELAGVFRDEIDRQLVPQLGSDLGKHYGDTKALYGALKDAATLAKSGTGRVGGFGLKDLALGAIGGSLHPAGIITAIGSKFMREHGPALVAKTADAIAKSPSLKAVAASMAAQMPVLSPKLGPYGVAMAEAFRQGPELGLATHMAYAQVDPNYAATSQLAGLEPEGPAEHEAYMARANGLADIVAAAKNAEETVDRHLDQVLKGERPASSPRKVMGGQDFGAKRMRRDSDASHQQRVKEIRQLASDPQAFLDRVSKNLEQVGPVAPGVTAALTARANTAVQYLAKAAEVPLKAGPLAQDWHPTEAEQYEFSQKLEVVEQPMAVLRHAAAGTLTDTQIEALHAVYPSLAKAIADKAVMRATSAKNMPYRSRMMLSLLAGVDLDGTTSQEAIASNQAAIHATNQKEKSVDAPPKSGARSEMNLAARTALPQQRRELESE